MKVTIKSYDGKLYIKLGRKYLPLEQSIKFFEKLENENKILEENLIDKQRVIDILEKENEQLKAQIEKMKTCYNCEWYVDDDVYDLCKSCYKYSEWELAE